MTFTPSRLLLLVAVIILACAAFGAKIGGLSELDEIALGAAFGFAAGLV